MTLYIGQWLNEQECLKKDFYFKTTLIRHWGSLKFDLYIKYDNDTKSYWYFDKLIHGEYLSNINRELKPYVRKSIINSILLKDIQQIGEIEFERNFNIVKSGVDTRVKRIFKTIIEQPVKVKPIKDDSEFFSLLNRLKGKTDSRFIEMYKEFQTNE